jgi:galactokinase
MKFVSGGYVGGDGSEKDSGPPPPNLRGDVTSNCNDIEVFERQVRSDAAVRAFLSAGGAAGPVIVARAPGRLDVMGGVADYSGALVAQATIGEGAIAGLTKRADRIVRIRSVGIERENLTPVVEVSLDELTGPGSSADYGAAHGQLTADPSTRWAAYIAGCFMVLVAEKAVDGFAQGANILLDSRVPLGAGVSSSAAIEVAAMRAISIAYGVKLDGVTLARLAQMVENRVVGAPCGIMDQMASTLGVLDGLMLLRCQPHEFLGTQTLPAGVRAYGINSNVKHSVGGGAYARARVAAFMGRKLIGAPHLAQLTPARYQAEFAASLPGRMVGADFISLYGETGDPITRIDPETIYPIRSSTEHAIYENDRVERFVALLRAPKDLPLALTRAGRLMYGSHWSYGRIGLGARETDFLVALARKRGPERGVYGAKISGGGSGGTVVILTHGDHAEEIVDGVAREYHETTGIVPQVFAAGLSPGAMAFGHREIVL